MVVGPPLDFTTSELGETVFPNYFPNDGKFMLQQDRNVVSGTVRPHHWFFHDPNPDEESAISVDLYCSEHLPLDTPLESVKLNGKEFTGEVLSEEREDGEFEVLDGNVEIRCAFHCNGTSRFLIERRCGFVRCGVILYQGTLPKLPRDEVERFKVEFEMSVRGRIASGQG